MDITKIENESSFVRDNKSKAILNINNESLKAYKNRKKNIIKRQEDIDDLKQEVKEIKTMLSQLLQEKT